MLKYYDVEQNTDIWMGMRAGKMTSSKLGTVMANSIEDKKFNPKKAFGEPAKKYAVKIALEQIKGEAINDSYSNDHMARGHEQEPAARALYESETFTDVLNGGFFGSDTIGCSPDGLVSPKGLIEIKSIILTTHFANIKRGGFDPAYKWQCIGNLKYTGGNWIDFVGYCEEFPVGKQLYIYRGRKEDFTEQFDMIDERVEEFMKLIEKSKEVIMNSSYFNQ